MEVQYKSKLRRTEKPLLTLHRFLSMLQAVDLHRYMPLKAVASATDKEDSLLVPEISLQDETELFC